METVISAVVRELVQAAVPLLITVLTGAVGWCGVQLRRWNIDSTVTRAIGRAVGAAYLSLLEQRRGADPLAIDKAEARGVEFVMGGPSLVPLLPKTGISPERLQEIVRAEIGVLLKNDPSVTLGPAR